MLAATLLAIFLIPVLYVVVERIARSERKAVACRTPDSNPRPPA